MSGSSKGKGYGVVLPLYKTRRDGRIAFKEVDARFSLDNLFLPIQSNDRLPILKTPGCYADWSVTTRSHTCRRTGDRSDSQAGASGVPPQFSHAPSGSRSKVRIDAGALRGLEGIY